LSSNENPLGPSPRAAEAFLASAAGLNRYPGGFELREALAQDYDSGLKTSSWAAVRKASSTSTMRAGSFEISLLQLRPAQHPRPAGRADADTAGVTVTLWFTTHSIRMERDRDPGEPYEIIGVDHLSTDNARRFLEDYSIAPWVRRVETDRSGPGPVRRAGAEAAQGDIFVFADAHVLFSPGFFHRVSATMRKEIWGSVGSLHFPVGWNGFDGGGFSTHYELTLEQNFRGNNLAGNFQTLTEIAAHGHGCVAVRKDRYLRVGGYHPGHTGYGGDENYPD
jgi:hypothetical protein